MEVKFSNLDEDGVVFRSCYERPLFAQNQSVVLHRTPVKCQSNRVNFLQRQQREWWFDFSTNQDWISQTVTFPNLSGRPFGTHRPVCGPWPEALIYKRQISIKSVESFLSFFNLFLFVNYILPLGDVVISSPNYINLLLKEFSWVSLFFRSAMQFW